jgi:hypothetical protein
VQDNIEVRAADAVLVSFVLATLHPRQQSNATPLQAPDDNLQKTVTELCIHCSARKLHNALQHGSQALAHCLGLPLVSHRASVVCVQAKKFQNMEASSHLSQVKQVLDDQSRLQMSLKSSDMHSSRQALIAACATRHQPVLNAVLYMFGTRCFLPEGSADLSACTGIYSCLAS